VDSLETQRFVEADPARLSGRNESKIAYEKDLSFVNPLLSDAL